jgi:4-hydroxybenzoate polyprenyltransferase
MKSIIQQGCTILHQTSPAISSKTVWRLLGRNTNFASSYYCGANLCKISKPSKSFRPFNPVFSISDVPPLFRLSGRQIPTNNSTASIHCDPKKSSSEHLIETSETITLPVRIVAALPAVIQPYLRLMRMDRPIGNWLVFLPCAWSITLATPAGQLPDPKMLALFAMGSFFMRGAGCTINDMWDKDFDSRVERTKDRPLACGQVTRFKALCFLSIPLSISLAILLTFNWNTIILGVCSMIPCIAYPLMKRVTYWPQAFLGITQNWGIMIAWSATLGNLDWPVLALYSSGVLWTMTYDTIYSHQDIEDDLKIGVKSTAIKFGDHTKYWLAGFTSVLTTGLLTTGFLCDQTWPYYLGVGIFTAHLGHQILTVNLNSREDCGKKFRSNRNLGLIFWGAILAANLLKHGDKSKET